MVRKLHHLGEKPYNVGVVRGSPTPYNKRILGLCLGSGSMVRV